MKLGAGGKPSTMFPSERFAKLAANPGTDLNSAFIIARTEFGHNVLGGQFPASGDLVPQYPGTSCPAMWSQLPKFVTSDPHFQNLLLGAEIENAVTANN